MFLIRENRLAEARTRVKIALRLFSSADTWVDPVFDGLANQDNQQMREIAYATVEQMIADKAAPYITMIIWSLFGQADRVMDIAMQLAESDRLYENESAQIEIFYLDELKLLRDHRRFPELLQKLGLTEYWASIGCQWSDDSVLCDSS